MTPRRHRTLFSIATALCLSALWAPRVARAQAGAAAVQAAVAGTAPAAQPQVAPPTPAVNGAGVRVFRGRPEDDLLHEMATRPVRRVIERFNSSTLVFHCDLGDGYEIAFKPARRGERDWWVHELAGYELARALGIEGRVPPAVYRRVPVGALDGFLRDADLEVERDGTVEGAAIAWMPVLRRTNLHTAESRAEWNPWLDPRREIPAEHRTRALQIASLIVFDYLQANFDRWNSANVPQDERGDLVFRDNNRGWYMQNLRLTDRGGIDGIRRIPASLLAAVERTTGDVLARRTVEAPFRVLRPRQVREYEVRRRALLARIDEAAREYGREHVVLDDADDAVARAAPDAAPAAPASPVTDERSCRHRHGRHHGEPRRHHHHHHHH